MARRGGGDRRRGDRGGDSRAGPAGRLDRGGTGAGGERAGPAQLPWPVRGPLAGDEDLLRSALRAWQSGVPDRQRPTQAAALWAGDLDGVRTVLLQGTDASGQTWVAHVIGSGDTASLRSTEPLGRAVPLLAIGTSAGAVRLLADPNAAPSSILAGVGADAAPAGRGPRRPDPGRDRAAHRPAGRADRRRCRDAFRHRAAGPAVPGHRHRRAHPLDPRPRPGPAAGPGLVRRRPVDRPPSRRSGRAGPGRPGPRGAGPGERAADQAGGPRVRGGPRRHPLPGHGRPRRRRAGLHRHRDGRPGRLGAGQAGRARRPVHAPRQRRRRAGGGRHPRRPLGPGHARAGGAGDARPPAVSHRGRRGRPGP